MEGESLETRVARIDENVKALLRSLPPLSEAVEKHDRQIFAAKVIFAVGLLLGAAKIPGLAEIVAGWFA